MISNANNISIAHNSKYTVRLENAGAKLYLQVFSPPEEDLSRGDPMYDLGRDGSARLRKQLIAEILEHVGFDGWAWSKIGKLQTVDDDLDYEEMICGPAELAITLRDAYKIYPMQGWILRNQDVADALASSSEDAASPTEDHSAVVDDLIKLCRNDIQALASERGSIDGMCAVIKVTATGAVELTFGPLDGIGEGALQTRAKEIARPTCIPVIISHEPLDTTCVTGLLVAKVGQKLIRI